jgi:hypothetical protein
MAICVFVQPSGGSGLATVLINGVNTQAPLPWKSQDATMSGTNYVCPDGQYILFTPGEFSAAAVLNVKATPPDPDVIQAEGVIFGAVLTAMCAVYGLKKIYKILSHAEGVGHE